MPLVCPSLETWLGNLNFLVFPGFNNDLALTLYTQQNVFTTLLQDCAAILILFFRKFLNASIFIAQVDCS